MLLLESKDRMEKSLRLAIAASSIFAEKLDNPLFAVRLIVRSSSEEVVAIQQPSLEIIDCYLAFRNIKEIEDSLEERDSYENRYKDIVKFH